MRLALNGDAEWIGVPRVSMSLRFQIVLDKFGSPVIMHIRLYLLNDECEYE